MANYVIEYKQYGGSGYRFLRKLNNDYIVFNSIVDARKKCAKLIKDYTATLCVIRGGVEKLVYASVTSDFVYEDRDTNKWYLMDSNGKLIKPVSTNSVAKIIVR